MSVLDLPPGIGLVGTPLATFHAPKRSKRIAQIAVVVVTAVMLLSWYLVAQQSIYVRWRKGSTILVLSVVFLMFAGLALAVRSARIAIARDGIRWGWTSLGFTQSKERIVMAHVYADGIALEAKRGSKWFLAARDWDRFEVLVRQVKRAELPVTEYAGKAPLRQRLQSYGRFLDALVVGSVIAAIAVAGWAA